MPTSPTAIANFLEHAPEPTLVVRGKSESWLRDIIHKATGQEWRPKVAWRGDDRDMRQLEAITFALLQKQVLLFYSPRTGKTRISLDWLQHLVRVGWVHRALIIPHSPLGVAEWERQIPIFSDLNLAPVRSGKQAAREFVDALDAPNHGIVCTWSTLQQLFSEKRMSRGPKPRPKLYPDRESLRILAPEFDALVVDEIHGVNDPSSLRFQIISELAPDYKTSDRQWRIGLTGTPFGRNPFGLWSQARIIDGGATLTANYYFFEEAFGKKKYSPFTPTKEVTVFDAAKLPVLRRKLDPKILTCTLADIQDVNVLASQVELQMSKQQNKMYQDLCNEMAETRQTADGSEIAKQAQNYFIRMRQIASGYRVFTDDEGQERTLEFPTAKLEWLEEFLSSLDPDIKLIIFHEFVRSGQRVTDLLKKMKLSHRWLWGGAKDKAKLLADFQTGKVPVLVANHASGGVGIDLSAAHYLCVFESPVGVIARQQMLARPMARGAVPLVVDDLVCAPVERKILDFQAEGRELSELFRAPKVLAQMLRA